MDRNLLLAFALSFLVLSTWSMWQEAQLEGEPALDQAAVEPRQPPAESAQEADSSNDFAAEALPELPDSAAPAPSFEDVEEALAGSAGRRVEVDEPLYRLTLNSIGARIERWELSEYFDKGGARVVLLDPSIGGGALTPFGELERGNLATADWNLVSEDADEIRFELERDGITFRKTYQLERDSYLVRVLLEVENGADVSLQPRFAMRWPARGREGSDFREQSLGVLADGDVESELLAGFGGRSFFGGEGERLREFRGEVDWAGAYTPYFLSAMFPESPTSASARFVATEPTVSGVVECFFDGVTIPPGNSGSREYRLYVGPKEVERLEALGSGAVKSIDLGWAWLAPLTRLFAVLLEILYSFVGNYGVAIILLTVLVRAVTTPLTIKQMKSMERMRALQPRIKELQEKYAEDRQKQSEEMMNLYRREKVNPLGGCLPLLLQMPVFIGLFYALRSSIQLRQAAFFGWIDDLSAPEALFEIPGLGLPFRVLPVLMAASMVVQQKLTPMQVDPAQQKMMMTLMPVMMLVLFYQFPSGLVLYWMISNVLAIAHQLYVGRGMRKA